MSICRVLNSVVLCYEASLHFDIYPDKTERALTLNRRQVTWGEGNRPQLTDGLTSQILSFVVSFLGNPALWQTNLFLSVWELFTLYKIVQPKADYKKTKLIHHTWNSYLISHQFLVSVQTLHAYSRGTEACPYCSVAHCLHQQSMMCCSAFACSWLLSAFYFSKGKNCLDFFVYFNRVLC